MDAFLEDDVFWSILPAGEAAPSPDQVRSDTVTARTWLRAAAQDPLHMQVLRGLLAGHVSPAHLRRLCDRTVLTLAAQHMAAGHLDIAVDVRAPRGRGTGPVPESAGSNEAEPGEPPPPPEEKETASVQIELVDENGEPVGGEEYWVRTASGKAITGRLDGKGRVRVKGLEPGTCEITFPNLNATDWALA